MNGKIRFQNLERFSNVSFSQRYACKTFKMIQLGVLIDNRFLLWRRHSHRMYVFNLLQFTAIWTHLQNEQLLLWIRKQELSSQILQLKSRNNFRGTVSFKNKAFSKFKKQVRIIHLK